MNADLLNNSLQSTGFGTENTETSTESSGFAQEFFLHQHSAKFVRESIPQRAVNNNGTGAYGKFTVTGDITGISKAKLFAEKGKSCPVFVRFSSMNSEKGTPNTIRDTRGFAVKFYTECGNWDLVGSNIPVFVTKDPAKFHHFMKAQARNPKTNLKNSAAIWEYWSSNPESLHHLLILMSERGIPASYRHMQGYGGHSFSMINDKNELVWVKFHLKSMQGTDSLSAEQGAEISAANPDFYQEDLVKAIEGGNFPKWTLYIQVMTDEQAKESRWNPFDVTKVWFKNDFPLIEVGELELNEIPENYHEHVEKAAFSPANLIEGIGISLDRMLQGRLLAYSDAQRYRIGNSSNHLEVNRDRSDSKSSDDNKNHPSFDFPNSKYVENDEDYYTQPGLFYTKALNEAGREILVNNIAEAMLKIVSPNRDEIINRQLCHFFRANIELGIKIATRMNINIDSNILAHTKM